MLRLHYCFSEKVCILILFCVFSGINVSDIKKLQEAGLHTVGECKYRELQTCTKNFAVQEVFCKLVQEI